MEFTTQHGRGADHIVDGTANAIIANRLQSGFAHLCPKTIRLENSTDKECLTQRREGAKLGDKQAACDTKITKS